MIYKTLILAFLSAAIYAADVVPSTNSYPWQANVNVGVTGGIPTTRPVFTTLYSLDGTGATDCKAAIQSAINSCPANQVVLITTNSNGNGRYKITSPITQSASTTLRLGAGVTILPTGFINGFLAGSDVDYPFAYASSGTTISSGSTQGSTAFVVTSASTMGYLGTSPNVGDMVIVSESNSTNVYLPVFSTGGELNRHTSRHIITGISGNTITIDTPLPATFSNSPRAKSVPMSTGIGLEGDSAIIDLSNCTGSFGIWWNLVKESWITGITITNAKAYHIYWGADCYHNEGRRNVIIDRQGNGPNGAGWLIERSSLNLVEDNIFVNLFPGIEQNFGCSGNVIAYNYNHSSDVTPLLGASFDVNHGAHNSYTLLEGNIVPRIQDDGYYGTASQTILARNWAFGTSTNVNQYFIPIILNRFSRWNYIVGNILGNSGYTWTYETTTPFDYTQRIIYTLGFPNLGNGGYTGTASLINGRPWADYLTPAGATGFQEYDEDVATTTTRKDNWNYATGGIHASEALGGSTVATSYFRTTAPSWWGTCPWPPFDSHTGTIPNASNVQTNAFIPAQVRFYGIGGGGGGGGGTVTTTNIPVSVTGSVRFRGGVNLRVHP